MASTSNLLLLFMLLLCAGFTNASFVCTSASYGSQSLSQSLLSASSPSVTRTSSTTTSLSASVLGLSYQNHRRTTTTTPPIMNLLGTRHARRTRRAGGYHHTLYAGRRMGRPRGPLRTIQERPTMNHEIKQSELRVVEQNMAGKDDALGIMSTADALALAESKGLDLILISDQR
jgi:hypothetical protein